MATDALFTLAGHIEETTYGTTPAAAVQRINCNGFPLMRPRNVQRPDILTNDRRRYAERVLQEDGSITVTAPLQYRNLVGFHEGLMANDEEAAVSVTATDISFNGTTGVIASVAAAFGSLKKGDWIYISGAVNSGNNGWHGPLTAAAAASVTVLPAGQLTTEAAGASVTIKTRRLVDANTPKSYSLEWQLTQLTNAFRVGKGFRVRQVTWNWQQGQFATESVELIGKAPSRASATAGTGGPTAAPTTDFMNCVGDFGTVKIDGASTSIIISQIQLAVLANLIPYYGLGSVGPSDISTGSLDGTITLSAIHDNNADTLLASIEAQETISMFWDLKDLANNRLGFWAPAVRANQGDPNIGAANSLVSLENVTLTLHDPNKDSTSDYFAAGGFPQFAIFMIAA